MAQAPSTRPDIDIDDDVLNIILRYPPLAADHHHIRIHVENGVVHLSGHTSSPINRRYLLDRVIALPGVTEVLAGNLYDDVSISLEAGQVITTGVIANARYGTVVLSGTLLPDADADSVAMRVAQIPGVQRVVTAFGEARKEEK
jgi:osmotically-inducible protein OsmY